MREPLEALRAHLEGISPHIVAHALWLPAPPAPEAARLVGALLDLLARPAQSAGEEGALCAAWRAALTLKGGRAPLSPEEGARLLCQVDAHALALVSEESGCGALLEWRRRWAEGLERLMRFAREEEEWLLAARAGGGAPARRAAALLARARRAPSGEVRARAAELLSHAARSGGVAARFSRLYQVALGGEGLEQLAGLLEEGGARVALVDAARGEGER
ncbi:MAG: hypothetical protein FJ138_16140, partial [Deltaproteobacteria bacterium]|nr:hypothetical protein [Deltaproteobacteria bacterium]